MVGRGPGSSGRRRAAQAAAPLLIALIAASCGGGDGAPEPPSSPVAPAGGEITVEAFEWGFAPDSIVITEGEEVSLLLDNTGRILHNLKVDDIAVEVVRQEGTGPLSGGEGELFVGAEAGTAGLLAFRVREVGTFEFYCTIEGHRELGMEGTLVVEPAS